MFIASFTLNETSGADNIKYTEAEAKEYLSNLREEFEGTGFEGLSEIRIYNPDLEERSRYVYEDQIFEDCGFLEVEPYFYEMKEL